MPHLPVTESPGTAHVVQGWQNFPLVPLDTRLFSPQPPVLQLVEHSSYLLHSQWPLQAGKGAAWHGVASTRVQVSVVFVVNKSLFACGNLEFKNAIIATN